MRTKVVAAICYRQRGEDVEFLLVRTKSGRKWTFPKGHIKRREREKPWEAAAREAREEAGVMGKPARSPLAHYLYRAGPSKAPGEYLVAAYLLKVESQHRPEEAFRQPTWFSPRNACASLAEGGRETRYVTEHQRVLKSALGQLKQ
ncbi:MAG: NUDIX domain-containing protein [Acidobacteriota bacterium]